MKIKKDFYALMFTSLFTINIVAQVTIGSEKAPNQGALLDLRDDNAVATPGGVTAKKGLGLPRVVITNKTLDGTANVATTIEGATGTWDKDAHVGLVVYNAKSKSARCVDGKFQSAIAEGLHVWNGKAWQRIPELKEEDQRTVSYPAPNVVKVEYIENGTVLESEEYYYADFGDAGTWMTESLRNRYTAEGEEIEMTSKYEDSGVFGHPEEGRQNYAAYPGSSGLGPTNPSEYNANMTATPERRRVGLLYGWFTANGHKNCHVVGNYQNIPLTDNDGKPSPTEIENLELKGYIQGICPVGWHLPSDRDWNKLEKELTIYPEKYSSGTYTDNDKIWTPNIEFDMPISGTSGQPRKIVGTVMKRAAKLAGLSSSNNGNSKAADAGGFAIYQTGIAIANKNGTINQYGSLAVFWSSSSTSQHDAVVRSIEGSAEGYRGLRKKGMKTQVRCKKN